MNYKKLLDDVVAGKAQLPKMVDRMELGGIKQWSAGYAEKEVVVGKEWFSGNSLFGGYIASLADHTMWFASVSLLDTAQVAATAKLNIEFYKPIKEGLLTVKARVVKADVRSQDVEAEFYCDSVLMAKAFAKQAVIDSK